MTRGAGRRQAEDRNGGPGRPGGAAPDYDRDVLLEAQAAADPLAQFRRWFDDALAGEIYEPNAMALATVGPDGQPSLRMVLLKDFDARGFVFYTNLESRKAVELGGNAQASLLFWWDRLHRQVRVEGTVASAWRTTRPTPTSPAGRMAAASAPSPRRRAA